MSLAIAISRPCYSLRLVRPFLRVLSQHSSMRAELIAPLDKLDDEERIPIDTLHELLRGAIAITQDEDIGLKAARAIELGSLGALEYAAASARTAREAIGVIGRYLQLVTDAIRFAFEERPDGTTIIRLDHLVAMPRAAEDFAVAAFYVATARRFPSVQITHRVSFQHEGSSSAEYAETFPGAEIWFRSPFSGFAFETKNLDRDLPEYDPNLHVLISHHADRLIASLPKVQTIAERVRRMLIEALQGGDLTVPAIARKLGFSTRTLTRKLETEGYKFKELLDEVREAAAIQYLTTTRVPLSEVAGLLGFSRGAAFTRAFKRWTGHSPAAYRERHGSREQ